MSLDWSRLHAVVLESDDWGLCAWVPDEEARRALADTPVFRSPAGRRYGGSTLETAEDVRALAATLGEFRGADGRPPVWQANTIVAAPDYDAMRGSGFGAATLPLVDLPRTPSRWPRPGLAEQISDARRAGVWWPELHGLHHLPAHAWLEALRRGDGDARLAFEQQSPVCEAVQAGGEYDPTEPPALREANLDAAIARFTQWNGAAPASFCPPDYRWDEALEAQAERLGVTTLQGKHEQHGARWPRARRLMLRGRWPWREGARFYMPARIAFEPCARDERIGVEAAHEAARAAWRRGQPAVISSHRVSYAHLESAESGAGRAALRDLLARLAADGAVFLVDAEVRQLAERGWSARALEKRGVLLRYHAAPHEPVRVPAPDGAIGVTLTAGSADDVRWTFESGVLEVRAGAGTWQFEWRRA